MEIESFLDLRVEGKVVLEVGGIGDYKRYKNNGFKEWRSLRLKERAREFVGVDINNNGIECLKRNGIDHYKFGDIEDQSLPSNLGPNKFDIILMLDVIEHLSNICNGLNVLRECLKDDGSIIITTPNPYSIRILKTILGKLPDEEITHTCSLAPAHLNEIFRRTKFCVSYLGWLTFDGRYDNVVFLKSSFIKFLSKLNSLFHSHIIVEIKKISSCSCL